MIPSHSTQERIKIGEQQLNEIFNQFKIDPKKYRWGDFWAGSGIWSLILSKITNQKVVYVDNDSSERKDDGVSDNPLVEIRYQNTNTKIEGVSAVFLRSSIAVSSLKEILSNQDEAELVIVMTRNDPANFWRNQANIFKQYYEHVDIFDSQFDTFLWGGRSEYIGEKGAQRPFAIMIFRNRIKSPG